MFPVPINNNSLVALNGLNGRCGWICRALDKVIGIANKVPIIGKFVATIAQEAQKVVDFIDNTVIEGLNGLEYEPTISEDAILQPWLNNQFLPYFEKVANEVAVAFGNSDFDKQLAQINTALLKMCVVKSYYANISTPGLSNQASQVRLGLIIESFKTLELFITKSVEQYETVITLNDYVFAANSSNSAQFNPLITVLLNGQQFACKRYVATEIPNSKPKPFLPIKTTPGTTVIPVPNNPSLPATPTTPTNTATTPTKSIFTVKNGIIGLVAGFLLNELFKKEKTKKE